jgi:DNA-binding winged helix-turn-helix (wHTH) protein
MCVLGVSSCPQCSLVFMQRLAGLAQGFSKENQSSVDAAYRFADFALYPADRRLKRADLSIRLQPKAFDALLCLVQRAQHLVSKQELITTLWPSIHVSEANLTNIIVSLRKIVGRQAISTVSKHGYRLELPVVGEPGVLQSTYEKFARAKELTAQRSLESMHLARDLYWTCLAEDPNFAPAWAWLGRCCWFMEKFTSGSQANVDLAQAAFQRAFSIDPDLASAHQFYTLVQVDTGRAEQAMCRLLDRLHCHPDEPESYTGLVQVLRFRGLLEQSLDAHKRATALDPAIVTSVAHTLFLTGDYARAIETYGGRAAYYLDAAAWAALGENERAITLLRERLAGMSLSRLMSALLKSLLALLEGRADQAVRLIRAADTTREPEIQFYFARHLARMGRTDLAMRTLHSARTSGFLCAPQILDTDPWLRGLQKHPDFKLFLAATQKLIEHAQSIFTEESPKRSEASGRVSSHTRRSGR